MPKKNPIILPDGTRCHTGPSCRRHGTKTNGGSTRPYEEIAAPARAQWSPQAQKVSAKLGEQLDSEVESKEAFIKSAKESLTPTPVKREPIVVAPDKFSHPTFSSHVLTSGVDVEDDGYYCDGCYGCEGGDDYCRGSVYENIRVESVNPKIVLSNIFGVNSEDLPQDLLKLGDDLGLGDKGNYYVETEGGWYGQEYSVFSTLSTDKVRTALIEWSRDREGAVDEAGVYEFVRAQGIPTKGLTPVKAMRAYLVAQYGPKPEFEKIVSVRQHTVRLSDHTLNPYRGWTPPKGTELFPEGRPAVAGIVRTDVVRRKKQLMATMDVIEGEDMIRRLIADKVDKITFLEIR